MPSNHCCASCNNVFSSQAWENALSLGQEKHPSVSIFNFGDIASFKASENCACCQSLTAALAIFPRPLSGYIVLEMFHIEKEHTGLGPGQHSGRCLKFVFRPGTKGGLSRHLLPAAEGNEHFCPSWTGPWARQIEPLEVRVDLVRSWLSDCETHHHNPCQPTMMEEAKSVSTMFIDVVDKCLVDGKLHGTDYVALSYVWGQVANLKTSKKDLLQFQTPGNISTSRSDIPRTIRDTMDLTRELGFRYLWVDSLCIVQDDHHTLQRNLENMGLIYANSVLTVVSTYGSDAESGLRPSSGSSKSATEQLPVLHLPHIRLQLQPETDNIEDITGAKWSSRAWTFQEAFFSRRCVIFGRETTWYCRTVTFKESEIEPRPNPAALDPDLQEEVRLGLVLQYEVPESLPDFCLDVGSRFSVESDPGMWRTFGRIIERYNKRDLSIDTDITRAIAGTMSAFTKVTNQPLHYGLPIEIFNIAMLWQHRSTPRRRGAVDTHLLPDHLPSWSWMGWQTDLDLCWDALTREDYYNVSQVDWHSREDCFKRQLSSQGPVVPTDNETSGCVCRPSPSLQSLLSDPFLYFRCQRSFFQFSCLYLNELEVTSVQGLFSQSNVLVGFVNLCEPQLLQESGSSGGHLSKKVELICISRGCFSPHEKYWELIAKAVADEFYTRMYRDRQNAVGYEFCNVLAIRREGNIALRTGLGRVEKSAWDMAVKDMIDVILG